MLHDLLVIEGLSILIEALYGGSLLHAEAGQAGYVQGVVTGGQGHALLHVGLPQQLLKVTLARGRQSGTTGFVLLFLSVLVINVWHYL